MKVKVRKYELVEHDVEMEFPFYGHTYDVLDSAPVYWDTYVKIQETGAHTTLTVRSEDGDRSFEFTVYRPDLNSALSNYGRYTPITEEKFSQAVWEAMDALSRA